jgi:hypothetical protein
MISAHEIRQKLAQVAAHRLSLNAFEDWFVSKSWNVQKESSLEAVELVASIHLLFSERDDKVLNEVDLRNSLLSLVEERNFVYHIRHIENVSVKPVLEARRSSSALVYAQVRL